jgi:transglutaminase-like putative cysteine protease
MRHENDQFALTLFLAVLAAMGTTALRHNAQLYPLLVWVDWLILAGLFAGLHWLDRRLWERQRLLPPESRATLMLGLQPATAWMIAALACLPIVEQFAQRCFGLGDPWEVVALCCLQVASLGMGLVAQTRVAAGTSVLLSSFQLLFVSFAFPAPIIMLLMAIYTLTVLWWLMGNYWGRLQTQLAARTISQMPARAKVLLPVVGGLSLLLLLVSLVAPQRALVVLNGFMPTTGGERWGDEYAQGGIGNGEILTGARDRADTVGPVDTNVYLSSQQPCLYDMISETYGKPSNHNERRIDVTGDNQSEHAHERLMERTASREFKLQRQGRSRKVDLSERNSTALIFVKGQVPLHLRMETFSVFDGLNWIKPEPKSTLSAEVDRRPVRTLGAAIRGDKTWIELQGVPSSPYFQGLRQHEAQIINLDSTRVPSPAALQSWYVPLVDKLEFFGFSDDDVLFMPNRERIPVLTTFSLLSQQVNAWELGRADRLPSLSQMDGSLRLPEGRNPAWRELAERWTEGCWTDGERVLRIESQLRKSYSYVDQAVVPEDATSAVDHFLASGQGQDYLFATTAAVMLRELGIPSRLVTGLYADQRNYDAKSQQTIFWNDDVHTWLEFSLDGVNWLPLEPTPSFGLPPRELTLWQWAQLAFWQSVAWSCRNWYWLVSGGLLAGLLYRFRGEAFDNCGRLSWLVVRWLPVDWQLWWCSRWLDCRLWLSGHRRPETRSYRQWLRSLESALEQETRAACERVFNALDAMHYDEKWKPHQADRDAIARACKEVFRKFGSSFKSRVPTPQVP